MNSKVILTLFSLFSELEMDLVSLRTKELWPKTDRKGLTQALAYVRAEDTLVCVAVGSVGALSLKQLIDLVQALRMKGIHFTSLEEFIDTSTPTGKFFFHVTGAC